MAEGGGASVSSSAESSSAPAALSMLDKPGSLMRKRKIDANPPPKGKRRARGEGANEPKNVSASKRVSEFPKESLTVSNKKLFCTACCQELKKCCLCSLHQPLQNTYFCS